VNGDRTAAEYAEAAAESAQRTAVKARDIADAALRMEQMAGRMERGLDDLRREVRKIASAVAVDRASHLSKPKPQSVSLTHEDFEETPTGSWKVSRETYSTKVLSDAKKWRTLWRRVRWAVWLILGAAGIKLAELGVERLFHK